MTSCYLTVQLVFLLGFIILILVTIELLLIDLIFHIF